MSRAFSFFGGLGLGAGLMYALDPVQGTRRRRMARDKVTSSIKSQRDLIDKGLRDIQHRVEGATYRVSHRMSREVPDEVLAERVRAKLGRYVTHPSSIEVAVQEGRVILSGPILKREAKKALRAAKRVPGVREVEDGLQRHSRGDTVPGLQGRGRRPAPVPLREAWPPSLRLAGSVGGAGLIAAGMGKRGVLGGAMTLAGAGMVARAALNKPIKRLVGIGAGRRAVDFQKTITVHAPIEEVYSLWSDVANYPRFMEHVKSVRIIDADRNRSHWEVSGPAGITTRWDAEVSRAEPNRIFAWRSLQGSEVENAGIVHFEQQGDQSTRLHIQMSYNPPAGAVGHVVAKIFGKDPKRALDVDMVRMKSLLEQGQTRAHGEQVTLDEIGHPHHH